MLKRFFILAIFSISGSSWAAILHTSGQAELSVDADMLSLHFKVSVLADTAEQARLQADAIMLDSQKALLPILSESDRLEASQLSLAAEYQYRDRERQFVGYKAQRDLLVELSELDKLASVLDAAMGSGVNEVSAMVYSSSKEAQYRQQVRGMAMEDSYLKAEHLAQGYHSQLGEVLEVRYRTPQASAGFVTGKAMMSADAAPANTYQAAQISYTDRVDVSFELIAVE